MKLLSNYGDTVYTSIRVIGLLKIKKKKEKEKLNICEKFPTHMKKKEK